MDHDAWSMVQDRITERNNMKKTLKAEYQPGGSKRHEILEKAVDYIANGPGLQSDKAHFCLNNLKMTETEYLECLNKASNGALLEEVWN